jgi:hypothetical protein
MVDDGDQRVRDPALEAPVEPEKRRVGQLILEKHVKRRPAQALKERRRQVVQETAAVAPPGQGQDFHFVALAA